MHPAILIILQHFFFDWFCQNRWMAENKSKDLRILLAHVAIIFAGSLTLLAFFNIPLQALAANAVLHGFIDGNLWRLYSACNRHRSPDWHSHNMHCKDDWFWRTLAIDQTLHLTIALLLFLPN
jgi:hypothetical protein